MLCGLTSSGSLKKNLFFKIKFVLLLTKILLILFLREILIGVKDVGLRTLDRKFCRSLVYMARLLLQKRTECTSPP